MFAIQGAWPVPDVNEPYYLGKAIHYWNPDWLRGDFFMESADTHKVFYFTFGWLSLWLGPVALWLDRTHPDLAAAGLGVAAAELGGGAAAVVLGAHRRAVRLSDGPLPHGGRMGHRRRRGQGVRLRVCLPGAGSAGAEPLESGPVDVWRGGGVPRAGGRMGRRGGGHRLASAESSATRGRGDGATSGRGFTEVAPPLRSLWPGLLGGLLLALPGLIPSLTLDWGVDPQTTRAAHQIYVFERLPHHLVLAGMRPEFILRLGLLWVFWLLLGRWSRSTSASVCQRGRLSRDRQNVCRALRAFVTGAVVITLVGVAIQPLIYVDRAWPPSCSAIIGSD